MPNQAEKKKNSTQLVINRFEMRSNKTGKGLPRRCEGGCGVWLIADSQTHANKPKEMNSTNQTRDFMLQIAKYEEKIKQKAEERRSID